MKNTAYDYHLRYETLKSWPSRFLIVIALLNYAFSFSFNGAYKEYIEQPAMAQQESNCAVPGAFFLANYSLFVVLGSGSFVIAVIVGAFSWRIVHLLCVVLCPVKTTSCFKKLHKVPTHA